MSGSTWPALNAGAKARASDVEAKFDWIEGNMVPMNGGNTTDGAYDLGTSAARWRDIYLSSNIRTNSMTVFASGAAAMTFNTNATVKLATGTSINEFSIDGTFADNSDSAVPTEKAIRTYIGSVFTGVGSASQSGVVVVGTNAANLVLQTVSISAAGEVFILLANATIDFTTTTSLLDTTIEINKDNAAAGSTDVVPGGRIAINNIYVVATTTSKVISLNAVALMSITSGGHTFKLLQNRGSGTTSNTCASSSLIIKKL